MGYLPNGLTEKQEAFCKEYVKNGFNGTQAAIKAGYSEETAYSIANENLNKPEIKNRLSELKDNIFERLNEELIINEIWKVYNSAQKESDKLKALELFGRYKAMFTDKNIVQEKTFEDWVIEQQAKETDKSVLAVKTGTTQTSPKQAENEELAQKVKI